MLFTNMAKGAGIGGVFGSAIGSIVGSVATTAVVLWSAPVSIPVLLAGGAVVVGIPLTATELGRAIGTVTGAGVGAVVNVVETRSGK